MKKTKDLAFIFACSIIIMGSVSFYGIQKAEAASVSIWWPTDGATIGGLQPFKALVEGLSSDDYQMYWQVDGGQLNQMSDASNGGDHKEAAVDVSGWHWSPTGAYEINFIAETQSGIVMASRQVIIHVNAPANSAAAQAPAVTPTPDPTPAESVWWPVDGAAVAAVQPFKARLENVPLSAYEMYWQVDGGQLNQMSDASNGGDHKEAAVDVSGWHWRGTGPYDVNFIAKDASGQVISEKQVAIYAGSSNDSASLPASSAGDPPPAVNSPLPTPAEIPPSPSPTPADPPQPVSADNPLAGMSFYVDPASDAAKQAIAWATSSPSQAALIRKIASQPTAKWFGDWDSDVLTDARAYVSAAASAGKVPILVAYDIPLRDCGSYSAGGATSTAAYEEWMRNLAAGIGAHEAVVILEPDALAMMDCLSSADQAARYTLINDAISTLKANPHTVVYLDAGNSNWIGAGDMAQRLIRGGIARADGFALNVSNFYWTGDNVNFGQAVSALVGGKHFIVDTSRNGDGPDGSNWCNPSGRALGQPTTANTGNPLVDGFLWTKTPGESDGTCNGGPAAGVWWPDYALGLAERAAW